MDDHLLDEVKPTPHYDRYPKSRITIRIIYALLTVILIWSVWYNWDFWSELFK